MSQQLSTATPSLPADLASLRGAAVELHRDLAGACREIAKLRAENTALRNQNALLRARLTKPQRTA